ncbi:hypothetical protein B0H63DRAFT_464174 [Podospora didyma]|uniref:Uncharacterized protein n=1 Tax=Podospora didyma TaxID=330526 RepID=A0AAE0U3N9_9PEZI|nr:hypothetical protein B0H63DRAFT_464174 [Podospora didyma]
MYAHKYAIILLACATGFAATAPMIKDSRDNFDPSGNDEAGDTKSTESPCEGSVGKFVQASKDLMGGNGCIPFPF